MAITGSIELVENHMSERVGYLEQRLAAFEEAWKAVSLIPGGVDKVGDAKAVAEEKERSHMAARQEYASAMIGKLRELQQAAAVLEVECSHFAKSGKCLRSVDLDSLSIKAAEMVYLAGASNSFVQWNCPPVPEKTVEQ